MPGKVKQMDQKTDETADRSTATPVAELSFEEALADLERVVDALERGDVPLERSIDLYERGEALRNVCEKRLKDAQVRVDRIVAGPNGEATGTVPLDGKPGAGSDDDIPF
jgi:exodeoxyribonuclease VII small subunit